MKLDKRNKENSKSYYDLILINCNVIVIFSSYGQFGAIRKPDFGGIVLKTYIFIKAANRTKKFQTQLSHHRIE